MEAPKKIYLVKDENTDKPVDYWYTATTDDSKVEYTRTDAFIENACNFIDERLNFEDKAWYVNGEVTIKDKVIEDFKKYMKGE